MWNSMHMYTSVFYKLSLYLACTTYHTVTVGMFGGNKVWQNWFDKGFCKKGLVNCVQSNCYVMCMWCLDDFSLAKLCLFAKVVKLSPCQAFPLCSIYIANTCVPAKIMYYTYIYNYIAIWRYCISLFTFITCTV